MFDFLKIIRKKRALLKDDLLVNNKYKFLDYYLLDEKKSSRSLLKKKKNHFSKYLMKRQLERLFFRFRSNFKDLVKFFIDNYSYGFKNSFRFPLDTVENLKDNNVNRRKEDLYYKNVLKKLNLKEKKKKKIEISNEEESSFDINKEIEKQVNEVSRARLKFKDMKPPEIIVDFLTDNSQGVFSFKRQSLRSYIFLEELDIVKKDLEFMKGIYKYLFDQAKIDYASSVFSGVLLRFFDQKQRIFFLVSYKKVFAFRLKILSIFFDFVISKFFDFIFFFSYFKVVFFFYNDFLFEFFFLFF